MELSEELYDKYTKYVATQLALAPVGTRVVTYVGACEEIPDCYDLRRTDRTYNLKLWIKSGKRRSPKESIESDPRRKKSGTLSTL